MANLSDGEGEAVSLFPMFNILACTLGVMIFVLATVATVSLGADKAVQFVGAAHPEGEPDQAPTWLEWDGEELIVHPSGDHVGFDRDLAGIETFEATYDYMFGELAGTPVGAELAAISLDRLSRYVVLLVRPGGFATLPEIRGYLDLLGIDFVEEPMDEEWRRVQVR